jgi:hypothetical protein
VPPLPQGLDRALVLRPHGAQAGRGVGTRGIAVLLNGGKVPRVRQGLPDLTDAAKAALLKGLPAIGKRRQWGRSYVAKLLTDRRVLGEMQPCVMRDGRRVPEGPPVAGYYPAIVTAEEWSRARVAKGNGRGKADRATVGDLDRGVPNLFTGLWRDARDGCTLQLRVNSFKTKFLVSRGALSGERGSVETPFPYAVFEQAFLTLLAELTAADLAPAAEGPDREAELKAELAVVEEKLEAIKQRFLGTKEKAGPLLDLLTALGERQKELDAELRREQAEKEAAQPDALASCQNLAGMLREAPADEVPALRLRVKAALRWVIKDARVLVVPHGWARTAAVQVWFARSNKRRSYVIHYTPCRGRGKAPPVPMHWEAHSLAEVAGADDFDLHNAEHVRALDAVLRAVMPGGRTAGGTNP